MPTTGSSFVSDYARLGLRAWEAAALSLAQNDPDSLTPWGFTPLELEDGRGNHATVSVANDALAIGPISDAFRLPLTPTTAQSICNLFGWLLPTPLLVFRRWQAAPIKLDAIHLGMVPNKGADLAQYKAHSDLITSQVAGRTGLVAGAKKSVVASNIWKPGKVVIFGWYQPGPDEFTNRRPMTDPLRQPVQPKSNVHGDFYVDYSHGIYPVLPTCTVNGQTVSTVDLYTTPALAGLVSNEGALVRPRYPSPVFPAKYPASPGQSYPAAEYTGLSHPSYADIGTVVLQRRGS